MRNAIAAVVLFVVAAGCASGGGDTSSTPSTRPEILLVQTSELPPAARFTDGALTVHYALRVENRAGAPITLRQVTLQSISEGAYNVSPTSKPFDVTIGPAQREEIEMWVTASPGRSLVGANGPVTMRVTCNFDSANGKFQEIAVRRVNERTGINGVR
jgi:hypothetical protein